MSIGSGAAVAAAMALALTLAPVAALGAETQQPAAIYDELVAQARSGSTDVDFLALRNAYAASPGYDPYGSKLGSLQRDMLDAYRREDCAAAQLRTESIFAINFTHIDAHFVASLCHVKLGNEEAARREQAVARGLIASILKSGDGASPATAFVVVTIGEEYSVLRALGLRVVNQSLVRAEGHSYDQFNAKSDETGNSVVVLFNIDRPLTSLGQTLQPEKK